MLQPVSLCIFERLRTRGARRNRQMEGRICRRIAEQDGTKPLGYPLEAPRRPSGSLTGYANYCASFPLHHSLETLNSISHASRIARQLLPAPPPRRPQPEQHLQIDSDSCSKSPLFPPSGLPRSGGRQSSGRQRFESLFCFRLLTLFTTGNLGQPGTSALPTPTG